MQSKPSLHIIIIVFTTLIATATSMLLKQQHQQRRSKNNSIIISSNIGTIDEESEQQQQQQSASPLSMQSAATTPGAHSPHSSSSSIADEHQWRRQNVHEFVFMESPQQSFKQHSSSGDNSGEIVVLEEERDDMRPTKLQIPADGSSFKQHTSFSQELTSSSPLAMSSGELLPHSRQILLASKNGKKKQLHSRNSTSVSGSFRDWAKSVKNSLDCSTGTNSDLSKEISPKNMNVKVASEKELKPFHCNAGTMKKMSTIFYESTEVGENGERKVKQLKVALDRQTLGSGVQAELYHGCVFINLQDQSHTHVGIKLIGVGTQKQSPGAKISPTKKQILEDPENEVNMLRLFQDDKIVASEEQRKYIIRLFDGGMILAIHHPRNKRLKEFYQRQGMGKFNFVEILELGGDTLMKKFISIGKKKAEPEEVLMDTLLEAAQVVVQVHQVVIHMDIKPQNFLFVDLPKEKKKKTSSKELLLDSFNKLKKKFSGENKSAENNKGKTKKKKKKPAPKRQILKAIDFGGSVPLPGLVPNSPSTRKLRKITSSRIYLPPEVDAMYLNERPNQQEGTTIQLAASTKTDMWLFGMMAYHLILFNLHPQQDFSNAEERIRKVRNLVERINIAYKILGDFKESDFIAKEETSTKQGEEEDEDEEIDVSSWPKLKEFIGRKINDFKGLLGIILKAKEQFPRLFLLISNLLLTNADDRLSAQGVVDFLSGQCKLMTASTFDFLWEESDRLLIGPLTANALEKMEGLSAELKQASIRATVSLKASLVASDLWAMNKLPVCDRSYRPGEQPIGEI